MQKSLDVKLADIHARGSASKAFILADAKDADMAFGVSATGRRSSRAHAGYRSLEEYRDQIRQNIQQGLIDLMLMSVSTSEVLTLRERRFEHSGVTPAVRANDTTDIHVGRHAAYAKEPSRPFATAVIDHAQCGHLGCRPEERSQGANLGLYSITFNNRLELDRGALEAYKAFRVEAEGKGFRHFLELFDPNAPGASIPPDKIGAFLNDLVARTLAGVASAGRPLFLKMVYHGPRFMEELARYDPHLVPGILGGASGTTYDAFKLLAEARKYGARAALYGRKINDSEHQPTFIQFLRLLADGEIEPEEAVRAYHAELERLKIPPRRPLEMDMRLTAFRAGYGGSTGTISIGGRPAGASAKGGAGILPASSAGVPPASASSDFPKKPDGSPDFAKMTPEQRLDYHRRRLDKMMRE